VMRLPGEDGVSVVLLRGFLLAFANVCARCRARVPCILALASSSYSGRIGNTTGEHGAM
jgi:hypothetical protein